MKDHRQWGRICELCNFIANGRHGIPSEALSSAVMGRIFLHFIRLLRTTGIYIQIAAMQHCWAPSRET